MASLLRRIFKRKKQPPLVCAVALDEATGEPLIDSPSHVHTSACFVDFEPLALVELFQSQGCASCPPALPAILEATQQDPNVLLLTENVTLFDHVGWKDTHASTWADQRHRAYARIWGRNQICTPQLVVNGCVDGTGAKEKVEVDALIGQGRATLKEKTADFHVLVDANDSDIRIDSDRPEGSAPYDVFVAVYQSLDQTVKPAKGPNKGTKMKHRNVVLSINQLGVWSGGNLTIQLPISRHEMNAGTGAVAFVQAGTGGPIIAATKI